MWSSFYSKFLQILLLHVLLQWKPRPAIYFLFKILFAWKGRWDIEIKNNKLINSPFRRWNLIDCEINRPNSITIWPYQCNTICIAQEGYVVRMRQEATWTGMLLIQFSVIDIFNCIRIDLVSSKTVLEFLNHFWTCTHVGKTLWWLQNSNSMTTWETGNSVAQKKSLDWSGLWNIAIAN